jgi:hypothetical protein
MEAQENCYSVRAVSPFPLCRLQPAFDVSRSHSRPALKSRSFDDRMEKATKAQAVKKLQTELKEEKQAEIQR